MRGKFIVIEGSDGAGKDTQIDLLQKEFSGDAFVYTREPGGTPLGRVLRDILLYESHGHIALLTEAFLFLADRAEHVEEVVRPALTAGRTVISNRSWISMVAFQVYGRAHMELGPLVDAAVEQIFHDCPIDLALILDIPPEVGLARQRAIGKKPDSMESMTQHAREEVRRGFLEAAQRLPFAKVINADRSKEAVYADVRAAVRAVLNEPPL